jgi:hypothetical protein
MSELTYEDVIAARHDIERVIYDYGEAAEYLADKKWEADHGGPEKDTDYSSFNRYAAAAEALRQLLPAIRKAMSKLSPEIWAAFLEGEAELAEHKAELAAANLAKAKAKGFETYEAMQDATLKARRSASANSALRIG